MSYGWWVNVADMWFCKSIRGAIASMIPALEAGVWPMAYDIAMGVRGGQSDLRDPVEAILGNRKRDIDAILRAYHVPERQMEARTPPHQ